LVTVIISILAGMVVLNFRGTATDARIRTAMGDISSYQTALDLYALENNDQYPKELAELATGKKAYIRDLMEDPWGNPYVYVLPGVVHKDSYDILSMGPDGTLGTEDDVAPWIKRETEE